MEEMSNTLALAPMISERELANEAANAFISHIEALIDLGQTKTAMALLTKLEKATYSHMGSVSTSDKISLPFATTAYRYQIETECSPREAMRHACIVHDKDFDVLYKDGVHNKRWYLGGKLVNNLEWFSIPSDVAIIQKKTVVEGVKTSSTFRKGQGVLQEWQKMKNDIKTMGERLDKLESENVKRDLSVEHIQDVMSIVLSDKEKAEMLKDKGYTYKEVAALLGKSERTIIRWLK